MSVEAILTIQETGRVHLCALSETPVKRTRELVSYADTTAYKTFQEIPLLVITDKQVKARVPSERDYELTRNECFKKVNLSKSQIDFFVSKASCPDKKNKRTKAIAADWSKLSEMDRLRFHCAELADGMDFTLDFLN